MENISIEVSCVCKGVIIDKFVAEIDHHIDVEICNNITDGTYGLMWESINWTERAITNEFFNSIRWKK